MGPLVTHVERIDTASTEGSPQWLFEAAEGLPPLVREPLSVVRRAIALLRVRRYRGS